MKFLYSRTFSNLYKNDVRKNRRIEIHYFNKHKNDFKMSARGDSLQTLIRLLNLNFNSNLPLSREKNEKFYLFLILCQFSGSKMR